MADKHSHHRPKYHISMPRGYLNDPNGPIELGDVFHLYFQSRSKADLSVPVEWGHATTPDLVHWTLQRPAMSPVPGGLDSDGCWSGNTVLDGDRVRAYYSGNVAGNPLQYILTALGDENGANFGPPMQVLNDPDPSEDIRMLRDPFVWSDADGWHMAVGCVGRGGLAAIRHYRSGDGLDWRFEGHLAELQRTLLDGVDTGEGWECPQILPVDGREIALVCSWSFAAGPAPVLAFPLGGTPRPHRLDDGHDFYAPSVLRDSSYGPLLFGWIMEGRDQRRWQAEGWSGAISLPRRAWLGRDASGAERLCTEPHPAVNALRLGASRGVGGVGARLGAQSEIAVPAVTGRARLWFGDEEWLDIELDRVENTVAIDGSAGPDTFDGDHRAPRGRAVARAAFDDSSSRPGVRVFVDGSVIEVFTSAGRSLTTRVYPTGSEGWRLDAPDGTVVWDLAHTVNIQQPIGAAAALTI